MKLLIKFNLVFIAIFALGLAAAGYVSWSLLQRNAQDEIAGNARLMMEAALAKRSYTSSQVAPLLETQMKYSFLPQSIPAFAATEIFGTLRKSFPEYSYKEAVLNPTNPRDRAVDWEADIINVFRNKSGAITEVVGTRDTPTGASFYVARPITITDAKCLVCHSVPEAAPATMIERYGPNNGFGWQYNEIVGAQIISVPTEVPLARAREAFRVFMLSITAVFIAIGVALNVMLSLMVIRPVAQLSKLADRVSLGEMDAPEFASRSRDEIGTLTDSFARMRKSLAQAMKMLET